MSKQKNKKFKRQKNHQSAAPIVSVASNRTVVSEMPIERLAPAKSESPAIAQVTLDEYAYVRKDIRMILLTILMLVVLLAAALIINEKTSLLRDFGDWIYRISNFQTS